MRQNPLQAKESALASPMAFTVLLVVGMVIRLVVLAMMATTPLVSDAEDYRQMAMRLVAGEHFVPYWPAGVPLFLTPLIAAGTGTVVLRVAMLLWWLLFCFGVARLAGDLRIPRRLWMLLLAIFTVAPAMVYHSIEPLTQMPAAALLVWALSASVRCCERPSWGEALLLGASAGYLALVRPSSAPLLLLLPAIVLWRRRQFAQSLFAASLAAAMLLAWAGYAHHLCGRLMINSSNGLNAFYGNNPWTPLYRTWYFGSHAKPGTEEIHRFPEFERVIKSTSAVPQLDRSAAYQKLAVDYIVAHPGAFVLRTVNRIRCFWGFDTFAAANLRSSRGAVKKLFPAVFLLDAACYLLVAGFAVFWMAAAPGSFWRRWQTWLLAGASVLYAVPYWVTMSHPTYHFPVVAPLALLGLVAYQAGGQAATRWRGWVALTGFALIQVEWLYFLSRN
ncbi:MAG TPA: hypothetical protein VIM60_00185 [Edaphobacter sp.]